MKEVSIDYKQFCSLVDSKSLLLQYSEDSDRYNLFAVEENVSWECTVLKNTIEASDFLTNKRSTANLPLEYRSVDGLKKIASAMFVDNLGYWVDGSNGILTIASGKTGYVITNFSTNFSLNGIDVHWSGANFGDYINFDVGVYNNNITSSQSNFIQIAQFANQYRILGDGTKTFNVDTVKTVPSTYNDLTVYIRTTYVNVGGNSVNLCVNLLGYK